MQGASENLEEKSSPSNKSSRSFQNEQHQLVARLLKRPILRPYICLPDPNIRKTPSMTRPIWEEGAEPMLGFSDLRKFKKVNETRIITPYEPKETSEKSIIKPQPTEVLELNISDPKRFLLEKTGRVSVADLESLVNLVRDHPDIGYIPMNREHMDLVNDYDPYSLTISSYNNIDKGNYVTVSPNGLLEFYKGDADFLPLDRLHLEQKLFKDLKQIPSFASFRLWKAFMVWFKKARTKRFIDAKDKMETFFAEKYKQRTKSHTIQR